jgi:hypothetical protein
MNEWNRLADISTNTRRYLSQSDVQRMGLDAATKLSKIHRMHRRFAAHAAAVKSRSGGESVSVPPPSSKPPPIPPQLLPAPGKVMAVELPADVPAEFQHHPPHAPIRQNAQLASQPRFNIVAPDKFPPSGNGPQSRPSSQQAGSPSPRLSGDLQSYRGSAESFNGVAPPPRPPKTPIPYPDGGSDSGIVMPLPPPNPAHSAVSLNEQPRPPYPVDEPPPAVNKQRKPTYIVR